jgi:hypothetical protein
MQKIPETQVMQGIYGPDWWYYLLNEEIDFSILQVLLCYQVDLN